MLTQATIQEMANRIAEQFKPEKIILFGSYARGEAHANSDLDLLVVMDSDAPDGQRSVPIRKMLIENYIEPIDVVVRSAHALAALQDIPGSFANQVLREGVVLYERSKQPV
jgi:uncharacterized protein